MKSSNEQAIRYFEAPEEAFMAFFEHVKKMFPEATEKEIMKVVE